MKYKNAKMVLPEKLFKELQKYVKGEILYVPTDSSTRAGWGENNGTKEEYSTRNSEIIMLYKNGHSVDEIAKKYYLSECSIRRIVKTANDRLKSKII